MQLMVIKKNASEFQQPYGFICKIMPEVEEKQKNRTNNEIKKSKILFLGRFNLIFTYGDRF